MDAVIPPSKKLTEPQIRADRVRLTLFLYRKQGMSSEEFSNYWRGEHSQIFANLPVVKKYLLTYEQAHANDAPLARLKDVGFSVVDYDGIATFEAASWDKLLTVFEDKEFKDVIGPDEHNFLDTSRTKAFPSSIVGIFDDPS